MSKTTSAVACFVILVLVSQFNSTLAGDNAAQANRLAVKSDLLNLSARAQQYYFRPIALGGGHGKFTGMTLATLTVKPSNSNGIYALTVVLAQMVVIHGLGMEKGNDGAPINMDISVFPDSVAVSFNN